MIDIKEQDFSMISQSAGEVIRLLRKDKNLSGHEFGSLIGLSQQQVSRYERGYSHLTLNLLMEMLAVLNISLDEFLYKLYVFSGFSDGKDNFSLFENKRISS
ncbi:helix-turn-helix domain-containing protein [Morganella morganii]|uniref:helix-turn-helix domain-containing protein n=1 Tax=Morganella morganii TaxID=582 RepID=UPI001BDB2E91|nr:helix-turn-helix transcriptional regulator [Morganella morganii]ELT0453592.1 helix-turn-helix transcriptional regulator [Morganella morganii]MBT0336866.1 helix-turn-helix transcriptional regulator [Morganella morganii subsp. morganii]